MRRRTQANPMRLLIMLAVLWAAGSWLFAAENSPAARAKPPAQTQAQPVAAQESAAPAQAPASGEMSGSDEGTARQAEQTIAKEDSSAKTDAEEESKEDKDSKDRNEGKEGEDKAAATAKTESAADAGASPRRFVPSEQVRADFDVSFPIDI